ncbi:MAG TPA: hypothetical protein VGJ03_02490 [Acidimicrobiales bacterium]|jgi:hypothetical protein
MTFALLGTAVALAGAAQAATTCNVATPTYPTIQSAVADPSCDVINVASGTYNENVVIPRTLTLNGAQAGTDARTPRGSESIINGGAAANITITADNVTVDGFTLNGPASSGTAALVMQTANSGETIQNNIVNNPGRAASITTSNTVFRKNAVNNTSTSTDGFQANTTPIHDVTFSDNEFGGADSNIYNADITIIEGNSNITVSGNASNGDGTLLALFKTNGAQIVSNTVLGANASAIYIGGADSNVTVSGNQVSSAISAVKVTNAFGDGTNSGVTITGNTLNNNQYGVNVAANSVTDTVAAQRNSVAGNTTFGIFNDPSSGGSVSGTCNWWGAASGPGPVGSGSGDKVSTGVNFTPWLVTSDLNGACIGGNVATNKDQCKNDGWQTRTRANGTTFKNQGDCIQYVNTGK